jgi:hypothetical protein
VFLRFIWGISGEPEGLLGKQKVACFIKVAPGEGKKGLERGKKGKGEKG